MVVIKSISSSFWTLPSFSYAPDFLDDKKPFSVRIKAAEGPSESVFNSPKMLDNDVSFVNLATPLCF